MRNRYFLYLFLYLAFSPVSAQTSELENDSSDIAIPEFLLIYEKNLDILKREMQPYDTRLAEIYNTLGIEYQEIGHHERAILFLKQSHQINRVNYGLYHIGHIKTLDDMFYSYRELNDWENVNNTYEHMYWLYKRNMDKYDVKWIPFLKSFYQWQLTAYWLRISGDSANHHWWRQKDIYEQLKTIIENISGNAELTNCFLREKNKDEPCTQEIMQAGNNS
jgi:tetratricopeptide (TPR) repeat protein